MKSIIILSLIGVLFDPISCELNCGSGCNPAGTQTDECIDGQCTCKTNVEGVHCDSCAPSHFGLSADNVDGCHKCYCSYVANECTESSLKVEPIVVPNSALSDSKVYLNNGHPDHCRLYMNADTSEMGCHYPSTLEFFPESFWQLPKILTGNLIKSYGGYLNLTQRFVTDFGSNIAEYHLVRLTSSRNTLHWLERLQTVDSIRKYAVLLKESEWFTSQNVRATRGEFMQILADVRKIEVRASRRYYQGRMYATYISNISLDTAVKGFSEGPIARQVELCRCPLGYEGTSCESCSDGYYRDVLNYETDPRGTCVPLNNKTCPCNGREKSCEMLPNQEIVCNCIIEYAGKYCQHTVAVRAKPMHQKVPRGALVAIACDVGYYNFEKNGEWETITDVRHVNARIQRRWSKHHNSLTSRVSHREGALLIIGLTEEESGVYICQGFGDTGTELIRALSYVGIIPSPTNIPPRIVMTASHKKGMIGLDPTISCLATGDDPITVTWTTAAGRALPPNVQVDGGLLKFHGINESDIDRYNCVATNNAGSVTEKAQVVFSSQIVDKPYIHEKKEFIITIGSEPIHFTMN